MPDPETLREHGFEEAARETEAVDEAEDTLGTTTQLKHTSKVRRAARLHRRAEISTGKLLEVVLVAIHDEEHLGAIRLPEEVDGRG